MHCKLWRYICYIIILTYILFTHLKTITNLHLVEWRIFCEDFITCDPKTVDISALAVYVGSLYADIVAPLPFAAALLEMSSLVTG